MNRGLVMLEGVDDHAEHAEVTFFAGKLLFDIDQVLGHAVQARCGHPEHGQRRGRPLGEKSRGVFDDVADHLPKPPAPPPLGGFRARFDISPKIAPGVSI